MNPTERSYGIAVDYGSAERVVSCKRALAKIEKRKNRGESVGAAQEYLAKLMRREIAYAEMFGG